MWYFALPYTLINVAGFMRSNRSWVRKSQAVVVWLWGAFAIIGTFLWATLAAETAIPYFVDADSQRMAGSIAAAIIAALILTAMGWRTVIRALRRMTYGLTLATEEGDDSNPAPKLDRTLLANVVLHSLVLLAVLATVIGVAPATNPNSQCVLHSASTPECVIYQHDWVTIFALVSLALSAILALMCIAANWICDDRTWSNTDADPLMAMAVLLSLSLMVLNLGWSAAISAVAWTISYLSRHIPGIDPPPRTSPLPAGSCDPPTISSTDPKSWWASPPPSSCLGSFAC